MVVAVDAAPVQSPLLAKDSTLTLMAAEQPRVAMMRPAVFIPKPFATDLLDYSCIPVVVGICAARFLALFFWLSFGHGLRP